MARTNQKVAASKKKNIMPKEEENIHANDEASSTSTSSSEAAAAAEDYFVEEDLDDASEDSGSEEGVDNDDDDAMMEPSDTDDNDDDNTSSSNSSSDDEDESGDEEGENAAAVDDDHVSSQGISNSTEQCTFDLTNLLAFNTHQINAAELYQKQQQQQQLNQEWYSSSPTIAIATTTTSSNLFVNESFLLAKAAEGTTQLLRELWKLPKEMTDVGLLAKLPLSSSSSSETKLPRSLVRRVCHVHYFSWMFIQFLSLPIIYTYTIATPSSQKSFQVGRICTPTRHCTQIETLAQGIRRIHRGMETSHWLTAE